MAELSHHYSRRDELKEDGEDLREKISKLRDLDKVDDNHLALTSRGLHVFSSPLNLLERRVLKGHFGKVYCFAWSPDSLHIASASQDGKLIIWNAMNSRKLRTTSLGCAWVMSCAYSPDRKLFAFGGLDNKCTLFNVNEFNYRSGTRIRQRTALDPLPVERELVAHQGYLSCCRFVDTESILTASGDTTCILWDIETSTPRLKFTEHVADVMSVAVFGGAESGGNIIVTGSCDNTSKVFDCRTKGSLSSMTFEAHQSDVNWVECLSARHGGGGRAWQTFASASDDSTCRLFDLRCQRELNTYTADDLMCGATSISFSKTGRYIFAGYDDTRCVAWDTLAAEIVQSIDDGHRNRVSCVRVSTDGKALCTGSWDSTLKIWA